MLKNYIKMAFKVLLRRKVFTCISLITISFTLMVLMVSDGLVRPRLWLLPAGDSGGSDARSEDAQRRTHGSNRHVYPGT